MTEIIHKNGKTFEIDFTDVVKTMSYISNFVDSADINKKIFLTEMSLIELQKKEKDFIRDKRDKTELDKIAQDIDLMEYWHNKFKAANVFNVQYREKQRAQTDQPPEPSQVEGKTLKPDQTSEPGQVTDQPETGAVNTWKDIVIEIIDNDTLSIKTGKNKASRLHCSEMGLMNKTKSLPNLQWGLLERLAKYKGFIPYREWKFHDRKQMEKQVSELRKILKFHFKIDSDPIPFKKNVGYNTVFILRDKRPGADTQ